MEQKKAKKRGNPNPSPETRFGGVRGNKRFQIKIATDMREHMRWCQKATTEELESYIAEELHPHLYRAFAKKILDANLEQLFKFTEQILGKPKEVVEIQGLPKIDLELVGSDED